MKLLSENMSKNIQILRGVHPCGRFDSYFADGIATGFYETVFEFCCRSFPLFERDAFRY